MSIKLLEDRTQVEQTDVLAQYLPENPLFLSKNKQGTNLRKVLQGLSLEFINFRDFINEIFFEYDPLVTKQFLRDWELSLGLPDDCFNVAGTNAQRRQQIESRFVGINALLAKDYVAIAAVFGVNIEVMSAVDEEGLPAVLPFTLIDAENAAFIILITFLDSAEGSELPVELPFTLGPNINTRLICLFEKLKPANTEIVYQFAL